MPPAPLQVLQTTHYARWFPSLRDEQAKARILVRIRRLSLGNICDAKALGGGISELRIDYGPGYRVYFARRGETLVLLLTGGDKSRQQADIARARVIAAEWKPTMNIETSRWDAANHLGNTEAVLAYLTAAFEDGDPALIAAALNDVARARGIDDDRALTAGADLASVIRTLKALGLELTAKAA